MSEKSRKLKVEGLSQGITESQLALILANKRRQGGGPIDNIDLTDDGDTKTAIVTFEESDAVDTILNRGDTVLISGVSARVKRYFDPCEQKPHRRVSNIDTETSDNEQMMSDDDLPESQLLPEKPKNKTKTSLKETTKKKEPHLVKRTGSDESKRRKRSQADYQSSDDEETKKPAKDTSRKKAPSLDKKAAPNKETKFHRKQSESNDHTADEKQISLDELSETESPPEKPRHKNNKSQKEAIKKKKEPSQTKKTAPVKETKLSKQGSKASYHTSDDEQMPSLDDVSDSESAHEVSKHKTNKSPKKITKKNEPSLAPSELSESDSPPEKQTNKTSKVLKEPSLTKRSISGSSQTSKPLRKGSIASSHVTNDDQTASSNESSDSETLPVKSKTKVKKILKNKQSTIVKKATSDSEEDLENPWDSTIKAKVLDITKSKDFYIYYFEDPSVSQGSFDEESLLLDGLNRNLYVTFHTKKAAADTVRHKHKPESNIVKVDMATKADFDTHENCISVHGHDCSTSDKVRELVALVTERSGLEVIDVLRHDEPRSAIIVFNPETCTDICRATWIFKDSDKVPLILAPVFRTSCVKVTGLKPQSTEDTVKRYFSNRKRSGGGEVTYVQRLSNTEALVFFKESADEVLQRNQHFLEGCELHISPYYPSLSSEVYKKQIEPIIQHSKPNPRGQIAPVPEQTSLPSLNFRVNPLYHSSVDFNPNPKFVECTIPLCRFGATFLIRQSIYLQNIMQSVHCQYSFPQSDAHDAMLLKLNWSQRVTLKEARSKLQNGLNAVCNYLDTFRVVQFDIGMSQIYDFQKFCQMRCKQEMPGVEYFFDLLHNKVIFISNHDELSINDNVNRMYHSFLSGKSKPDVAKDYNFHVDTVQCEQRVDTGMEKCDRDGKAKMMQDFSNRNNKSGSKHKGKKKKTSDISPSLMKDNLTEDKEEIRHEQLTIEQESELEEKDIIMLQKTDLLKEIENANKPMKIILNCEKMKAIIKGNDKSKINSAELELLKKSKDFISLNIQGMFLPEQVQLLGKQDIQEKINKLFDEKNLQAHFKCNDNRITLYFTKGANDTSLKEIVNSQVVVKKRPIDKDLAFILQSEKGRKFLTGLCQSSDGVRVSSCVKVQEKHLQIIASSKQLDLIEMAVNQFESENKSYEKQVHFSSGKQAFVRRFLSQNMAEITSSLTPLGAKIVHNTDNITVQGLKDGVSLGDQALSQLRDMIVVQDIVLKFFGIKEYLQTDEGKSLVTGVENNKSCIISSATVSHSEQGASVTFKGKQTQSAKPPSLIASTKVGECTFFFMQGDITAIDTDAIINPLDATLKCQSGLGKALVTRGGYNIQSELASSNAQGIPGEIIETSAGNLNKCRTIIHVVCPVFTGSEMNALEGAVTKCFKHISDQDLKSVAIPAIGTGKIFKFLPVVACKLLMKSLQQHLTSAESCLRNIYLCDIQADHVKELIERFKHIFGQDVEEVGQLQEASKNAHAPAPVPSSVKTARAGKDFRHIKVNFITGAITKQKTDVIVVTIGKILDLSKGGMTRDIVKYGGDAVQQELTDNYGDGIEPGKFGKTSGRNLECSNIYYVRLHHWKGNSDHMRKVVYKLLQSAEEQNATSMSIPAIGTGNLGYPPDFAADAITDAICQFAMDNPKSSVKSINLVVFPRDTAVVQAFQSVLSTGGSRGFDAGSGGHDRPGGFSRYKAKGGDNKSEVQFKSVKLSIKKGDITAEKCDAIISGIRDTMDMSNSGAVCKTLLKKCGTELQDECSDKKDEMSQTGFVVTSAPNLNCKQIYHVSMDRFSRSWDKCITQVLIDAESKGLTSIAMPALGAGARRADYHRTKKSIFSGVDHFDRNSPSSLKDVRLVVYSEDMLDEFMGESDSHKHTSSGHKDDIPTQFMAKVSDHIDLKVYATSHQKIADASNSLNELCKKAFKQEKEKDKEVKRFSKHQVKQLEDEGMKHCVQVSVNVEEGVIIMKGFRTEGFMHVLKLLKTLMVSVVEDHHNSLHRAVVSAIKWQYEQGKWIDFEPLLNSELEGAYKNKSKHHDITDAKGRSYRIDFHAMKEFKLDEDGIIHGQGINVRRYDRTKEGEPLPKGWDSMGSTENLKLVPLQAGSPEYKSAEQSFIAGGANVPIKKIERVQNKSLYQQFKAKKREMNHRNPKGHNNEKRLFHGTDPASITAINENGFNRSYCGKNATAYGDGVYFAVNSSYSVGYARPSIQGTRSMYIARVLTGVSTQSSQGMKVLPNKPGTTTPFDSGCDNISRPVMFIIFHDAQAYPEYLITF